MLLQGYKVPSNECVICGPAVMQQLVSQLDSNLARAPAAKPKRGRREPPPPAQATLLEQAIKDVKGKQVHQGGGDAASLCCTAVGWTWTGTQPGNLAQAPVGWVCFS